MSPAKASAGPRRRGVLGLAALGWAGGGALPVRAAPPRALPLAMALDEEIARAQKARQPLVVMVSLHGCAWCDEVRANYLAPMLAEEQLAVVQVDMRSPRPVRGARGEPTTHEALVRAWGVKVAPTLLFLGAGGAELAERLAGGASDLYGAMLDRRMERARKAIGA